MEQLKKQSIVDMVEKTRRKMHEMIDRECDNFLLRLDSDELEVADVKQLFAERTLPLYAHPSVFKRQKPVSVTFADERIMDVRTWKNAVTAILKECNSDPVMHQRLLDLRGSISGRQRAILSDVPDGMDVPLCIDEGIYVEGKYDAETMMHVLTNRIFRAVGYDYSGIEITVRDPQQTYAQREEPEHEEIDAPSMMMQM